MNHSVTILKHNKAELLHSRFHNNIYIIYNRHYVVLERHFNHKRMIFSEFLCLNKLNKPNKQTDLK